MELAPVFFAAAALLGAAGSPFSPDKMDSILCGVACYPEYIPGERLEKDVMLMQKAGINVVRVGESTWNTREPRDGEFQFGWMQRVLDRMHTAGIRVILGTPTYSIPPWLAKQHPEILVTHNGAAPPLSDPYSPSYPASSAPEAYGLGAARRMEPAALTGATKFPESPALLLISPGVEIARRWKGFAEPAELGLTLKYFLGPAGGNPALETGGAPRRPKANRP